MTAAAPTISDLLGRLDPGSSWSDLVHWPPDAFAAAGAVLADSGAYRLAVSPPAGHVWPDNASGVDWTAWVRKLGRDWAEATGIDRNNTPPTDISDTAAFLDTHLQVPLSDLCTSQQWDVAKAIFAVFGAADEACAGIFDESANDPDLPAVTVFHLKAAERLALTGSVATLHVERARVLPKLRVPESGITIRSLSRYAAFHRSEVATQWAASVETAAAVDALTILVVPWPDDVFPTAFRRLSGHPVVNMDPDRFGFFEFSPPADQFDPQRVVDLVRETKSKVGRVDIVVLPESVLTPQEASELRDRLRGERVDFLVAGVRRPAKKGEFGENYALIAPLRRVPWEQHKHHRWFLNRHQIQQYHLGSALPATKKWWEAINVKARSLTFVEIQHSLVMCPLVCEDLARPDPVADVIRSVAPSLVIALLLDGPQLAARWPARYATVLADDPGSAVLTVSPLGLVLRCTPAGKTQSRVVALWKDRKGGPVEIALAEGAAGVAVTVSVDHSVSVTADGRAEAGKTIDLFLSGVEQIKLGTGRSRSVISRLKRRKWRLAQPFRR